MINQSHKFLKENFLILLLIDIIYFVSTFLMASYLFNILLEKIRTIVESGAELQYLSAAEEITPELASQISSLNSLTASVSNIFFLLPLTIFILYILLQGTSWKTITTKKFSIDKNYLFKFTLTTIVSILLITLLWKLLIKTSNPITFIPALFIIYLTMISYVLIPKTKTIAELLKKSLTLGIKNLKTSFSVFVIFFFFLVLSFMLLKNNPIILAIIFVLLYIYFKVLFTNSVKHLS